LLSGCTGSPQWYAPPEQQKPIEAFGAGRLARSIAMTDPNADAHLVRDISHLVEGGSWRWAGRHPQMRFYLDTVRNLKFSLEFSMAEATFRETGPVTLTFLANGRPFDQLRYSQPGRQSYKGPVPETLLKAGEDNIVEIEPDKVWISKDDGAALSILILRAGFVD
jgi:hypothetical protein